MVCIIAVVSGISLAIMWSGGSFPDKMCAAPEPSALRPSYEARGSLAKGVSKAWWYWQAFASHMAEAIMLGLLRVFHGPCHCLGRTASSPASGMSTFDKPPLVRLGFKTVLIRRWARLQDLLRISRRNSFVVALRHLSGWWMRSGSAWSTLASANDSRCDCLSSMCCF